MLATKQKGLALLTVLLVVAMVTVLATDMAMRLQMQIKRSDNLQLNEQAYWYALGAEEFVRLLLKEAYDTDKGVFHLDQSWAMKEMVFPLDEGEIAGEVEDLYSCFNINAVYQSPEQLNQLAQKQNSDPNINRGGPGNQNNTGSTNNTGSANNTGGTPDQLTVTPKEQFMALLEALDIENYQAEQIRDSVYDWLDPDSDTSAFGAEDYVYEARIKPHLAANSLMADESEVRMVEGINKKILDKIAPYICVIPNVANMVINVNTVTEEKAEVLHAMLAPKLSLADAKSVIANRPSDGYKNIDEFWGQAEISALGAISPQVKGQFTVDSQYFKMKAVAEFNRSWFGMHSILVLDKKGQANVIARKIGV